MSYKLKVGDYVTNIAYTSVLVYASSSSHIPYVSIGTVGKVIEVYTPLDGIPRARVRFDYHNAEAATVLVYASNSSLVNVLSLIEALEHGT